MHICPISYPKDNDLILVQKQLLNLMLLPLLKSQQLLPPSFNGRKYHEYMCVVSYTHHEFFQRKCLAVITISITIIT